MPGGPPGLSIRQPGAAAAAAAPASGKRGVMTLEFIETTPPKTVHYSGSKM